MREHIGVFASGTDECKQSDSGDQWRPTIGPACAASGASTPRVRSKKTKGGEYRGRCADRTMGWRHEQRVEKIPKCAGPDDARPGDPRPEQLAREITEKDAEAQICDQVSEVDVQRKRGDHTPQLPAS